MMLLSESVLHVRVSMATQSDARSPLTSEEKLHVAADEVSVVNATQFTAT